MQEPGLDLRLREYDRVGELARYLTTTPNPHSKPSSETTQVGWTGTRNYAEAIKMLEIGWAEGVVEMKEIVEDVERVLLDQIPHPVIKRGLSGSDVDMGAYLSGEPENMLEWEAAPISEQGIKIIVNGSASASVSPRTIKARGAVIVATIHALQMLEIPVELWGVWTGRRYAGRKTYQAETRVRISRPGYELDIERVAFVLAHPSMLRRIVFSVWEREEPKAWRKAIGIEPDTGYGTPTDSNFGGEHDIYLGKMYANEPQWLDTTLAVEWILNELRKLGVELEA